MIMGIRDLSESAERTIDLIPNSPIVRETHGLAGPEPASGAMSAPLVDGIMPYEAVWDCVTCGACVEACPVLIEHVDKIVGIRRNLVLEESRFPQELTPAFRAMEGQGNPWGQPASARLDWTKPLPFPVRTVADVAAAGELDQLEVLYWVGCAAAFDPRNQKVARAVATCLHAAGVSFAILGQEESCTGDPARRMGNDYVFQILASGAVDTLNRYQMGERTIVTACPHCFNTIANEYPDFGAKFEVVHHTDFLLGLVAEKKLIPRRKVEGKVVFHDSCYLGRYNDVYDAPRRILEALSGVDLREAERSKAFGMCCGAGGGRMWVEERPDQRVNFLRVEQLLETKATTIASACPYCMTMLSDGVKNKELEDTVKNRDVLELAADALVS
jgi:Fe-S oxidoreductase